MKPSGIFILILFFIIITLSIVQVVISNKLSTTGIELGRIDDQITALKNENNILQSKLLTRESFINIASSASTLGFVEEKESILLSGSTPLALK
ncbi:MAG: hypothetical protein M1277_00495 [Patescibacteria group bacterium]|nr:hypothetical protein [Patescibacteria group bacterium]